MVGTIITCVVLMAIVALIIRYIVQEKKKGKSPICGGDCGHCGHNCPHAGSIKQRNV